MDYTLEKLEVYQLAEVLSDEIWEIVIKWDFFHKDTIGKQIVRSADSISANIAEGYGRFFYKESKQFYFYSRGSIQETKSWIGKCKRRKIADDKKCEELLQKAETILVKLNAYIKFISKSSKHNPK
ncbi:MAG: four helix bundle protein [Chitinophagaceae bacterium]|mgnify:CR=1 FL=1|nr:four helix bundle protein [Chitinophagaceae bacterium]MBK8606053.1 four helix bundle protein [Chitinophagaceae bacterium]MBP6477506.1 four helix bundle protein [Chitinophagaceae bacterium]MBP7107013.1 four helix bundle protein [Chitinophagaceae bacterium]MBP7314683.1 four helix bundle protein [Chitinophagaceae bacterium]